MFLANLKYGETQMTLGELVVAFLFYACSRSSPPNPILPPLSNHKPFQSIFSLQVLGSILFQFLTHLSALVFVWHLSEKFVNWEEVSPFKPNVFNTSIFLFLLSMQSMNFLVN